MVHGILHDVIDVLLTLCSPVLAAAVGPAAHAERGEFQFDFAALALAGTAEGALRIRGPLPRSPLPGYGT